MRKQSQRQYAKTIGVSHWAVGKAIRAGHIKRGFDKKTKKINVKMANKEWGNAIREKQKKSLPSFQKENRNETATLMSAFANYCTAYTNLLNAIENEIKRLR